MAGACSRILQTSLSALAGAFSRTWQRAFGVGRWLLGARRKLRREHGWLRVALWSSAEPCGAGNNSNGHESDAAAAASKVCRPPTVEVLRHAAPRPRGSSASASTDGEVKRAMRKGVGKGGQALFPDPQREERSWKDGAELSGLDAHPRRPQPLTSGPPPAPASTDSSRCRTVAAPRSRRTSRTTRDRQRHPPPFDEG